MIEATRLNLDHLSNIAALLSKRITDRHKSFAEIVEHAEENLRVTGATGIEVDWVHEHEATVTATLNGHTVGILLDATYHHQVLLTIDDERVDWQAEVAR